MSADEDTELRDLLIQTLDKNGSLGKIKAELRASVFLALNAHDNFESCPLVNPRLQKFMKEKDSMLCMELIQDFFQHLDLDYTNSVFGPETNNAIVEQPSRESLCQRLGMKEVPPPNLPVLASCVRSKQHQTSTSSVRTTPSEQQLQRAKDLFESKDRAGKRSVGVTDVVDIFAFLCPMFPVFLIDRFVSEELSSTPNPRVTWTDFTCLYEKLFAACQNVVVGDEQTSQFPSQMANFHKDQTIESPPELAANQNTKSNEQDIASQYLQQSSNVHEEGDENLDAFYDDCMNLESPLQKNPPDSLSISKLPASTGSKIPVRKDERPKSESTKRSTDYEDDFTADSQSIPEDLPEVSGLSSSSSNSLADLTEDHTLSHHIDADYMEDSSSYSNA